MRSRIAPRSVGQSRIPGFAIAFVLYRLFVCTGLHDYSAFAGPAMSRCDYPPCAKSLQTFFASVLDRLSLFVFHLFCSCCKFSAYRKVCFAWICKGEGIEKGRGIPLPFSVFLVPFVTSQKERPFLFPLEKEQVLPFILNKETGLFLLSEAEIFMLLFPRRKANDPFAGCGKISFPSPGGDKKRGA